MRRIALLLAVLMITIVAACGGGGDSDSNGDADDSSRSRSSSGLPGSSLPSGGGSGAGRGLPTGSPTSGGGSGAGRGFITATLPDDFPVELVPPDAEIGFVGNFGGGLMVEFTSTATIEKILAFYKDALGEPTLVTNEAALWSIFEEDKVTSVNVTGTDGDLTIVAVVGGS